MQVNITPIGKLRRPRQGNARERRMARALVGYQAFMGAHHGAGGEQGTER